MLDLSDFALIVGGDFNAVWLQSLDRTGVAEGTNQHLASSALRKWASDCAVVDVWRTTNPSLKEFSCFSARHRSFSRIDYIFISKHLFEKTFEFALLPMSFSDHWAVFGRLAIPSGLKWAARWRFNSTLLQNESFLREMKQDLDQFLATNRPSVDDPRALWLAVKEFIRDKTIGFASNLNKTRLQNISELENKIATLESLLALNATSDLLLERDLLIKDINELLRIKSEFLIHRTRQHDYLHSAQPSHLLASKLKTNEQLSSISSVRSSLSKVHSAPTDVNDTFCSYYSTLYSSEFTYNEHLSSSFLNPLQLPKLSYDAVLELNAPITLSECHKALESMNKNKSPGLDGIPPEFYLTFWPQIGPLLLDIINFAIKIGSWG